MSVNYGVKSQGKGDLNKGLHSSSTHAPKADRINSGKKVGEEAWQRFTLVLYSSGKAVESPFPCVTGFNCDLDN